MRTLWIPEVVDEVKTSCSRKIIGFITNGDFSFIQARGYGVGYIALGAIPSLLSNCKRNKVLIRNTSSRQYYFAELDVVV